MEIIINGRCLEGKRTGVGRYLANILRVWTSTNDQNHYDIYFKDQISEDPFLELENVSSTIAPNIDQLNIGPIWENVFLPRSINKNKKADVYFSPSYTLPIYPYKCKQVVTIFDISYIAHPEWFPRRNRIPLQILTKPTIKKADVILTGSEATKLEIMKYYDVNPEKINVTNLGVEKKFVDLDKEHGVSINYAEKVREKYQLSGKVVLFIGLVMNRRNIPVVMEAISKIIKQTGEKITLVIIGKNHTFPFFDIEEVASKYNIKDSLIWLKYTSDEEIFGFYKAADVFVCASLYEGFNITPLEAMSLGVPLICSNLSSLPEVVGDASYLLNDPRDPIEMIEAIQNVLFNKELNNELREKGKARAKIFSWDKCAAETIDIFERLV
jgi:glycosyltransferase involved in cell wall biosynthesis